MNNTLISAESEFAEGFLQRLYDMLVCISECCNDAAIISEGIYHGLYANEIGGESYDYYAGELLYLSLGMQEKATELIVDLLDDITTEATQKLADSYAVALPTPTQGRKLDKIAEFLKKLKAQNDGNPESGGDGDGNSKKEG